LSLETDDGKRPITLADISRAADSRVAGETLDGLLQSPGESQSYVTLLRAARQVSALEPFNISNAKLSKLLLAPQPAIIDKFAIIAIMFC